MLAATLQEAAAQGRARRDAPPYPAHGSCDGLPGVDVKTQPGFCAGLFASGLRFPRGLLPLPGGDLLVTEMGGWTEKRGRITRIRRDGTRAVLIEGLDRPHGLAMGPDGKVYAGAVGTVFRFDPARPAATREAVIGGKSGVAPLPATGRHPLVNFVFDRKGDLYVGVGSASDNCEGPGGELPAPGQPCAEAEGAEARGAVRRYAMQWPGGKVRSWRVHASGLRNSMALAVHPATNALLQGENSRDAIHARDASLADEDLPHDELNLLVEGGHHGWPYCYDAGEPSPEYPRADCSRYRKPVLLLPPHAAPLGMTYDRAAFFVPGWHGALIVAFHGYRSAGHRVVAYRADGRGVPLDPPVDLIAGWERKAAQPMGAPVDVKVGADGALYVSEDRNGTILRLARMERRAGTGK